MKKELERLAEGWAISKQCFGTKSGARKGAFTLAEVLITLGIIGVVAALTLPSLIQKYQDQVLENQLKKMYSTLSQGIQKAMADDGVSNFYDTELFQACKSPGGGSSNACIQMVKKYFNVVAVKKERREYYVGVIQTKYIDGKTVFIGRDKSKRRLYPAPFGGYNDFPFYVLADGSEFKFYSYLNFYSVGYGDFYIDTNGEKGPNVPGFDMFNIYTEENSANGSGFSVDSYLKAIQENNWKFPW